MVHKALSSEIVIVAGLGEVGNPLLQILKRVYECVGVDVAPVEVASVFRFACLLSVPATHFVGTTAFYIKKYKPALAIINSTLGVGRPEKFRNKSARLWYTALYEESI